MQVFGSSEFQQFAELSFIKTVFQLENSRIENNQLKSEVGMLRYQLHSKSIALHDLSCSLDEEKYKNSLSGQERRSTANSSFNAVYDKSLLEEPPADDVFRDDN